MAQAFFERGVPNYIGTGWLVDDSQALTVAETFYQALLQPESIGSALSAARCAVFNERSVRPGVPISTTATRRSICCESMKILALNGLYAIGDQNVRHNDAVTFDVASNEALQRRIGKGWAVTAAQDVARCAGLEKYRGVLALAAARERSLGNVAAQRMHMRRRAR